MKAGKDGRYYFVRLNEEDLFKLEELVLKKVRERSNSK
jgi:hypothetical protein